MDFLNMNLNEDENSKSFEDWFDKVNEQMSKINENRQVNKINEVLSNNNIKNIK